MTSDLWRGIALGMMATLVVMLGVVWMPSGGWAPQPLIRMGIVDWEQVLLEYEEFQQDMEELEQREQNLGRQMEDRVGENGSTGGEDTDDLGDLREDLRQQLVDRRREIVQSRHREVLEAIEEEAIQRGYSLVLSENDVLYASEDYTDLTRDVINRLNQQ